MNRRSLGACSRLNLAAAVETSCTGLSVAMPGDIHRRHNSVIGIFCRAASARKARHSGSGMKIEICFLNSVVSVFILSLLLVQCLNRVLHSFEPKSIPHVKVDLTVFGFQISPLNLAFPSFERIFFSWGFHSPFRSRSRIPTGFRSSDPDLPF